MISSPKPIIEATLEKYVLNISVTLAGSDTTSSPAFKTISLAFLFRLSVTKKGYGVPYFIVRRTVWIKPK